MKKVLSVLFVGFMIFALVACSSGSEGDSDQPQDPAKEEVTLKFNLVKSSTDPQYEWYGRFFDDVKEATDGVVNTEIYTSESLGPTADVIEQAAQGEAIIADCDVAYLSDYVPDFAAVMSPYLIQTPEEGLILWESDVFQDMRSKLADKGLHLIAMNYEGTRNLITKSEVNSREEISDLKIRCAPTTMWNAVVDILNGNPTNIPMSEVYNAFSQGVADGGEGVYSVNYSNKWYEVCKYITKTEHLTGFTTIVMSSEVFNSLPEEAQEALEKTAFDYMGEFAELSGGVQDEYMEKLKAEGVVINEIDKTPFIEAAKSIPTYFPEWTDGIFEELQAVLEAAR